VWKERKESVGVGFEVRELISLLMIGELE